ncbi:MAG: MFS transporter [Spirochaetaceae bacterium]|nr:MAG: MFS transporter [Spirochaetaceae bacterium]
MQPLDSCCILRCMRHTDSIDNQSAHSPSPPVQFQMAGIFREPILFASLLGLASFAVSANALPSILTTAARDLNFPVTLLGTVVTAQFMAYAVFTLLGGWLVDRFRIPEMALVLVGLSLISLALFLVPRSGPIMTFYLWAAVLGGGGGLIESLSSVIISDFDTPGSSRLLNLSQFFYCLGAVLAPQIAAYVLRLGFTWYSAFSAFGISTAAIAACYACAWWMQSRRQRSCDVLPPQPPEREQKTFVFSRAQVTVIAMVMFLYVLAEGSMVTWTVALFEIERGLSASEAAQYLSLFWTGMLVTRASAAFLPLRLSYRTNIMSGFSLFLAGLVFLMISPNPLLAGVSVFLVGAGAGPVWATVVNMTRQSTHEARSVATIVAAGSLGVVVAPSLTGQLIEMWGFSAMLLFVCAVVTLALLTAAGVLSGTAAARNQPLLTEQEP